MAGFDLRDVLLIGDNNHGYEFGVGRMGEWWVGFARGDGMLFFMPEICEGPNLGLQDRDKAIRQCCAVALRAESAYGGVDRWFIPAEERGTLDDLPEPDEDDWFDDRDWEG